MRSINKTVDLIAFEEGDYLNFLQDLVGGDKFDSYEMGGRRGEREGNEKVWMNP